MRLVLDTETTTKHKGNPFTKSNWMVMFGLKDIDTKTHYLFRTQPEFSQARELLSKTKLLIGFNIKFDLHWLQRYGLIDFTNWRSDTIRIWDGQIAHFIFTNQQTPYPSLDSVAEYYNLAPKLDIVRTEYWEKGIDTSEIPTDVLTEYLIRDLDLTEQVFREQQEDLEDIHAEKTRLISLANQDLLVLAEMEWNGIKYNSEASLLLVNTLKKEQHDIEQQLHEIFKVNHPVNWNSREELSAMLYGGTVLCERQVGVGVFKTGKRAGQAKYKKIGYPVHYPRLVEPIQGSDLKKDGLYSTDEPTLQKLKFKKEYKILKKLLLRRVEIEKLCGTYLEAFPTLINFMEWETGFIHPQFNQVVAITGRLSCKKPNLQNPSKEVKQYMESRYDT